MIRLFQKSVKGFSKQNKDYYKILGIERKSNAEEIKNAYRDLVKQYHPDVQSGQKQSETNLERFREIAEAYSVLSIQQSKINYDYNNKSMEDNLYNSKKQKLMEENRMDNGQLFKENNNANSYEQEKREWIKQQNRLNNVDQFGRFKGGVPQFRQGFRRGQNSKNLPGTFNYPDYHNLQLNPYPDMQIVDTRGKLAFNRYTNEDQLPIIRREQRPWFQAKVDYHYFDYAQAKRSLRHLRNLIILFIGIGTFIKTYIKKSNRAIIAKLQKLKQKGEKAIQVNGQKVFRGHTGIYRLE